MSENVAETKPPRKLPLKAVIDSEFPRQGYITTIEPASLDNWEGEYVSLSGFAGPYGFDVFAAAPVMLEALRTIYLFSRCKASRNHARAAIALVEGQP